jgi:nucleotide-binding universal stress UspA family protein/hemerythrin-like domain-containing protein
MKRILVALDRSAVSISVLARAVELARATGAKLRLMRAVALSPALPPGSYPALLPSDGNAVVVQAAEAALRELESEVPAELRDGVAVDLGGAADAICRAAKAYDADIVVIGAHRYGVMRRALGTTAAKVVNRIDRPVLVVRAVATRPVGVEAGPSTEPPPKPGAAAGAIGGPPEAVAGGQIIENHEALRAGGILRRDHQRLEELYATLLSAYHGGDWADVSAQWDLFEAALRAHMETEESDVFPAFRAVNQKEADALLAEHTELRRLLSVLGVQIDLHALPSNDAEELIARLRAHSAREERLLYPWVDEAVAVDTLHGTSSAA